nr:virulence RhuM family protein [Nitrosomonas sp.]
SREIDFYNLDAIISVGYRVNSYKATQFRKWATSVLKEYLVKGFALDDDRLKQGNKLFGKDYFDELIERIRRIRTSERMFWQKVTDLYSQCSVDYDKNATVTQSFFAQVQNKFHYAIHHHTAAELVKERADATKPNMGLVHYANMHKDGMILKTDVPIGKNYLTPEELDELERLVENYLGTAELFAKRKIVMTMKDWVNKLDEFLRFNAYDVLEGSGKVSGDSAKKHALTEYEKFMAVHEKEFISDFDKFVDEVKIKKRLPT